MSFFFNDTATTEIYTLSLHDALPIFQSSPRHRRSCPPSPAGSRHAWCVGTGRGPRHHRVGGLGTAGSRRQPRSEEHTSELQSRQYLVCRLLLEKIQPFTTLSSPLYTP